MSAEGAGIGFECRRRSGSMSCSRNRISGDGVVAVAGQRGASVDLIFDFEYLLFFVLAVRA